MKLGTRADQTYPISILEAITTTDVVLLTTPRGYPEYSLPWVIAGELQLLVLNNKQVVPVVIAGDNVKPPRGYLSAGTDSDILDCDEKLGAVPVVVLYDFPIHSRNRVQFLVGEVKRYPRAKFIIVNRDTTKVVEEMEFLTALGAKHFEICDISFSEISSFFQRSFNITEQEAGVVSLRLHQMCRKFKIVPHPTYFAGVASENLNALLLANRRSELLQLAVSGFLTFSVSGDDNKVAPR